MTSTSLTLRCIGRRADTHDVVSWQFAPLAGNLPPVLAGAHTAPNPSRGPRLCSPIGQHTGLAQGARP